MTRLLSPIADRCLPCFCLPQFHAGFRAVGELDASRLQGGADRGDCDLRRPGETEHEAAMRIGDQMADNVNSGRVKLDGIARNVGSREPRETDRQRLERIVAETAHKWNTGKMGRRDLGEELTILRRLEAPMATLQAREAGRA